MRTPHIHTLLLLLLGALVGAGLFVTGRQRGPVSPGDRQRRIQQMYAGYRRNFAGVPEITPAAVAKLQAAGTEVIFVDVRENMERAVSIIPGALSIDQFEAHLDRYRKKIIVVYCTIGVRSGIYARDLLRHRPDLKIHNLAGSILAWTHAGLPLQTPAGETTRRVHVYGPRWNLLPPGYEAVY